MCVCACVCVCMLMEAAHARPLIAVTCLCQSTILSFVMQATPPYPWLCDVYPEVQLSGGQATGCSFGIGDF